MKAELNNIYCMKDSELMEIIEKESIDALITDPPYFIGIKGKTSGKAVDWDKKQDESDTYLFFKEYFTNLLSSNILKDGATILIFNTRDNVRMMQQIASELKIWEGNIMLDYSKYNAHSKASIEKTSEYIFFYGGYGSNLNDTTFYEREVFDAINIRKGYKVPKIYRDKSLRANTNDRVHDTQKPNRLLQQLISRYTKPNDTILDTFSGSASISLAAYEMSRNYIACEMDKNNYMLSMERLDYHKKHIPRKFFNQDISDSTFQINNARFLANDKYRL